MPGINNPATATVKVISADKGIKFFNPQTRQIEEVVSGLEIPVNAILEFSQQAELELTLDGQIVVIQGSSGTGQSIAKSLGLTSTDTTAETTDSLSAQYQPLPSLQKTSELSRADLKSARTTGFTQPVVEQTSASDDVTAYDLVVDDIRHPDADARASGVYVEPEEDARAPGIYVKPEEDAEISESGRISEQFALSETPSQPPVIISPPRPVTPKITGINPDTGASDKDFITRNSEFDIFGISHNSTAVELLCEGVVIKSNISVNSDGKWSYHWQTPAGTKDQLFNFTSRAVRDGVTSQPSDPVLVHVKTSDNQILVPISPSNIRIEPDTGYINDDLITNSHSVAIHGDSLIGKGLPVNVQVGDLGVVTLLSDEKTGHWKTDVFKLENDGKYDVKAWYGKPDSTDKSTKITTSFEINTTKPQFDDENFLSQPVYSNDNPPVLHIETEVGNRVTAELIDSNDEVVSKASGQAASTAHLTFDPKIAEGQYTLKVVLTDPVGNEEIRQQEWHANFTKPNAPTVELIIDDNQIVDDTNYVQSEVSVLVNTQAASTTRFTDGRGNALEPAGEPVPNGSGKIYRFNFSEPGNHKIQATSTDLAENVSNKSEAVQFQVLTSTPTVKELIAPEESVFLKAGEVAQVQVKFDQSVKLTEPDQLKLILQLDDGQKIEADFASQSADSESLTFNYTIARGDNAAKGVIVPVDALDAYKVHGLSGVQLEPLTSETLISTLIIDTVAPATPEITHLSTNSVDDPSFNTNASEFDLMGRADADSRVQLYNTGNDEKIGEPLHVLANKDWWSPLTTSASEVTETRVYVIASDAAGNSSPKSASVTITSDPVRPEIDSIEGAETSTEYVIGDEVAVTLKFSKPILVSGDPGLNLQIGNTPTEAKLDKSTIAPDSLTFKYLVTADSPASGQINIARNALEFAESDHIRDAFNNSVVTEINQPYPLADCINTDPAVTGINPQEQEGTYTAGDKLSFSVDFNKPVSLSSRDIKLVLQLDGKTVLLPLSKTTEQENISLLVFEYTVGAGESAKNGITVVEFEMNGTTIIDSASQEYSTTVFNKEFSAYSIDTPPALESLTLAEGTVQIFTTGKTINVELRFDKPVKVTEVGGKLPLVVLTIGDQPHPLTLAASDTAKAVHTLSYPVTEGDSGTLQLSPLNLNGARISDDTGLDAQIASCALVNPSGYQVVTTPPEPSEPIRVVDVQHVGGPRDYKSGDPQDKSDDRSGDLVEVKIIFSEPVILQHGVRLKAFVGDVSKFMKCKGACSEAGSEFTLTMRTQDRLVSDNGFIVTRFQKDAKNLIHSADGREVDIALPKKFHFKDATFNSDTVSVEQPTPQTTETSITSPSAAVDREGGIYKAGETITVKLAFEKTVNVVQGQNPALTQLKIGNKLVNATLKTGDGTSSELEFTYDVPVGLSDNDGITLESINPADTRITDTNSGTAFDLSTVGRQNLGANVDSIPPQVTTIVPEQADQTRYIPGDTLSIEVRLSKPAHAVSSSGSDKPYLELELVPGKPTVQALLDESACTEKSLIFTYSVSDESLIATEGVKVSSINLGGTSYEDSAGNPLNVEGISTNPLDIFVLSPYPSLVSAEDALISDDSVMITSGNPTIRAQVPDGVDNIDCQSMSYSAEQTKAIVGGTAGEDISQVPSPLSTGYALQLNGGYLRLDDMSKVFKGDFTVCSRVQTTASGSDRPWLSPSLIGKENPGSTNDMFLFMINSSGHAGIALGDRYGAMTSKPVSDGESRYICISRDLTADDATGSMSTTQVYINGIPDGNPVNVYHKGHSALENDPDARRAPEAGLTIELDTIGHTASEGSGASPIPFAGTIDDLEISPFAMNGQQVADAYTQHLHIPMTSKGGYEPVGLLAVISRPQLTSADQVKVTFSQAIKDEKAVDDQGYEKIQQKTVDDSAVQFDCELNGNIETYNLDSGVVLNNPNFDTFRGFRCKPTDTDVSTYRVSFDNQEQGAVHETLLLIGSSKGAGLYFDGIVHDGLSQSGNSDREPKPTPDYFIAEQSAVLDNVGPEDLIILDTMPEMQDLLGKKTPAEVESALNELVYCSHSVVKPLSSEEVSDGNNPVSLTINTIAPDQPVTAYLAGEPYTINPDHIV